MQTVDHSLPVMINHADTSSIVLFAPIGAFGNHVRNLLLMDECMHWDFVPSSQIYDTLAGPSWPSYVDYCAHGLAACEDSVQQEILDLLPRNPGLKVSRCQTVAQKIDFFHEVIYPTERTWQNWLWYEWRFRKQWDSLIRVYHSPKDMIKHDELSQYKAIGLMIDPALALHCYFKFNSNLNNQPPWWFLDLVERQNHSIAELGTRLAWQGKADTLFQPRLCRQLYSDLVNSLGLQDHYDVCAEIHKTWYQLHKKSELEFVSDVTARYGACGHHRT